MQHAEPPHVPQLLADVAGSDQAQPEQQQRPAHHPPMGLGLAVTLHHPRQRQHDRNAGHENEQRKNEVVEVEALPGDVNELAPQKAAHAADDRALAARHLGERRRGAVDAEQPKHVDAAQRVDRADAAGLRRLRSSARLMMVC